MRYICYTIMIISNGFQALLIHKDAAVPSGSVLVTGIWNSKSLSG